MKWIYRILRLFFCPHKHIIIATFDIKKTYKSGLIIEDYFYRTQCKYCGKLKVWDSK